MIETVHTIHGYNANPYSPDREDRPDDQQEEFANAIAPHRAVPHNWFSAVQFDWSDVIESWTHGHWNTYSYAYKKLALRSAEDFYDKHGHVRDLNVFGHSLGSRVVLQVAYRDPRLFKRIALLNGAERVKIAMKTLRKLPPSTHVLNVVVKDDDVLDKAAGYMSPGLFKKERILGQDGLTDDEKSQLSCKFTQIVLDDMETKARFFKERGWNIAGNNPDSYGDHHYSFKNKNNWPIYEAFFSDKL